MVMDFSYLDELLAEELPDSEDVRDQQEGYRHVWVLAELAGETASTTTLEALGQGRTIADQFGVHLVAVVLADRFDEALGELLIRYGADQVLALVSPDLAPYQVERHTQVMADQVEARRPEILLLSTTPLGSDLAPRLAQRLGTGLMAGCVELSLDMAERQLLGTVPVLGGRVLHTFSCPEARPQIATLVPGAFPIAVEESYRSGTVEQVAVSPGAAQGRIQWLDMDAQVDKAPIPLSGAKIVVGAGRGLRDQAGLALARQLADLLDGQMAGSRGALDEGWIDVSQLVGMSGQTVRPKLYIACGVSGAIQHNMGLQETGFLVAINQDDQAPMMQIANVGAVGDAQQIISALIQELADLSNS